MSVYVNSSDVPFDAVANDIGLPANTGGLLYSQQATTTGFCVNTEAGTKWLFCPTDGKTLEPEWRFCPLCGKGIGVLRPAWWGPLGNPEYTTGFLGNHACTPGPLQNGNASLGGNYGDASLAGMFRPPMSDPSVFAPD
jgi:hypothetical protein